MNSIQLHPIIELRRFCAGCLRVLRRKPDVDPELMFDAASQIAEEIRTERLEHDRKIAALVARAQALDSPGGRNITPTEAAPIVAEANEVVAILANDVEPKRAA